MSTILPVQPRAIGAGTLIGAAGHAGLREAIARHIGVSRGMRTSADEVIVTNGSQQAIDLITRVLLEPGDVVAVEDPGYPLPRRERCCRRRASTHQRRRGTPLSRHYLNGDRRAGVLLGYGAIDVDRVEEGLRRLGACL